MYEMRKMPKLKTPMKFLKIQKFRKIPRPFSQITKIGTTLWYHMIVPDNRVMTGTLVSEQLDSFTKNGGLKCAWGQCVHSSGARMRFIENRFT